MALMGPRPGGFAHSLCGEVVIDPTLAGIGPCSKGTFGWEGIYTTKFAVDPAADVAFACFSQVHPCWNHNVKAELGPHIFGAVEAAMGHRAIQAPLSVFHS